MHTRRNRAAARQAATVEIANLAAGGDGVGRIGGKAVFVPLTAPGDVAEIELVEERRSFCRGRALRIVRPSPARVEPGCPAFGVCGGCGWRHVSYAAQLEAKRSIVENALRRIGRLEAPPAAATVASPLSDRYRHRARLHAAGGDGPAGFGFFRPGSHQVVPIERCPVLHPALETLLGALNLASARHPAAFAKVEQVRLATGWGGGAVSVTLWEAGARPAAGTAAVERTVREEASRDGVDALLGEDAGRPLALGPGKDALVTTGEAFTQVNLAQNVALVATAIDLAAPSPGELALDLCCGVGNLALPLAARGLRVTGVDLDSGAVRQAAENARRLGIGAELIAADAAAAARALAGEGRRFDLALVNPPRTGALAAMEALAGLLPARIVMVSCDPATLARDAAVLAAAGYRLEAVRPLDLFPQTAHVETVVRLTHIRA